MSYYQPAAVPPPYYRPRRDTDGMAIASLVVSLHAFGCPGIGLVGAILGHVAKRRIRENGTDGNGLATAGIVIGWLTTVLTLLVIAAYVIFVVWAVSSAPASQ